MENTRNEIHETPEQHKIIIIKRWILAAIGTFFVALGILGIFLPLLPTTVFLLLAAYCYAHSSERLYRWLHENKIFGAHLKNYREGRGIAVTTKIVSLTVLWTSILFSMFTATESLIVRVILAMIGVGVTIHLLIVPTLKHSGDKGVKQKK